MKLMNYSFKFNESNTMMNMNKLNDKMMMIMVMIMTMILMIMMMTIKKKVLINKMMFDNQNLETMWTIFPTMMIMLMSMISIPILYLNNEMKMSSLTIKIIGNQWFWTYSYLNFNSTFNSYMMYKSKFNFNIMETDNKLVIPFNTQILLISSSTDVIHSWSIPSMNIKMDSSPGQANSMNFQSNKIGILMGQCSEICGVNHSFMPIMIESVLMEKFIKWMKIK